MDSSSNKLSFFDDSVMVSVSDGILLATLNLIMVINAFLFRIRNLFQIVSGTRTFGEFVIIILKHASVKQNLFPYGEKCGDFLYAIIYVNFCEAVPEKLLYKIRNCL